MRRKLTLTLLLPILVVSTSQARAPSLDRSGEHGEGLPDGAPRVVVEVECDAGESIAEALRTPAAELVVRIRGICEEDVEIRRDHVTLAGTDPAVDGIHGTGSRDVVAVSGAWSVTLEKLSIFGPSARVLVGRNSNDVRIAECDLTGTRVEATQRSDLRLHGSILDELQVDLGARVLCFGSSMVRADVLDGGIAHIGGSYGLGPYPPTAIDIRAQRGILNVSYAFIDGTLEAHDSSVRMTYAQVEQGARLTGKSHLELESTDVWGPLVASGFSTVWIYPESTFYGSVVCLQGADASCERVNQGWGHVQGCPSCELSEGTPNPLTFRFDGHLSDVPAELSRELAAGETFSMTYTFNASTPSTSYGSFENAVWEFSVTVGSRTWTGARASIGVRDDASWGWDEYSCGTSEVSGPSIAGWRLQYVILDLIDFSGTAFPSMDGLPVVPPDPVDFDTKRVELPFGPFMVRAKVESSSLVETTPPAAEVE